jgi:enoyl-CoA hydratase/carnithine racemase
MNSILTHTFEDGVVVVTVDNPPVNAFTIELTEALTDFFATAGDRVFKGPEGKTGRARAVILNAESERSIFISGADISLFLSLETADDGLHLIKMYHRMMDAVAACPVPVICAVEGLALGGGTEIACCADIRVAGEKARFSLDEVRLGIIPGGGGTQRVPRLIGTGQAKRMILTAQRIDASEAHRVGLVDVLAPEGGALAEAKRIAGRIAENAPAAVRAAKHAIDRGIEMFLADGLAVEREAAVSLNETREFVEGATAFFERRKPMFSDIPGKQDTENNA